MINCECTVKTPSREFETEVSGAGNLPWVLKANETGAAGFAWRIFLFILVIGVLMMVMPVQSDAAGQEAFWKVGRAIVQKAGAQKEPVLKLSLRNDGRPSMERVVIKGRWGQGMPGKRSFTPGELAGMVELGSFTKEVELKHTVILEVPFSVLGNSPQGSSILDIAIYTGQGLTDGQAIAAY